MLRKSVADVMYHVFCDEHFWENWDM